jgi:hypothetical protein
MVGADAPHETSGQGIEVCAVVELQALELEEFHESLVNEAGRLKGLAGSLARQLSVRDLAELVVHEVRQLVQRLRVAGAAGIQEIRDILPL